ncbi:GNAT family N-acetyltransferase [Bacillus sp. 1P06AnD]|uniref:GNAT family N-acetyltransferase n=1 Tax=Bacillus sp. 1P06AnD TaxID=3132208 RepID=UPI0039A33E80
MIHFEPVTRDSLYIISEIVNSNDHYNKMENGHSERTEEELLKEFFDCKDHHLFIKADDTYIGLLSYLDPNPKDETPWIGLFMIHKDYQGFGYGTMAYIAFEEKWKQEGKNKIRLGVLEQNTKAKTFWESHHYRYYKTAQLKGNTVLCYEKNR